MLRRTGIRAVSTVEAARRRTWTTFRREVIERDGERCVVSGHFVNPFTAEVHHRKLRKHGGPDSHTNCITLCDPCHDVIHDYPTWSKSVGLLVPPWMEPGQWPALLGISRAGWSSPFLWQLPDESGTWLAVAPHPDQDHQPAPWQTL